MRYTIKKEMWDSVALKIRWFERYRVLKLIWRGVVLPVTGVMAYLGAWYAPIFCSLWLWVGMIASDVTPSPQAYWTITIVTLGGIVVLCAITLRRVLNDLREGVIDLDVVMLTTGLFTALLVLLILLPYSIPTG
jgi:hypothetical protein